VPPFWRKEAGTSDGSYAPIGAENGRETEDTMVQKP